MAIRIELPQELLDQLAQLTVEDQERVLAFAKALALTRPNRAPTGADMVETLQEINAKFGPLSEADYRAFLEADECASASRPIHERD